MDVGVSIHAPTRGATTSSISGCNINASFNPRTHEGCDLHNDVGTLVNIKFQSTHPRGVRPNNLCSKAKSRCVSIHAPTRGATQVRFCFLKRTVGFNPRTHEGCDSDKLAATKAELQFQSTHPRGVRLSKSSLRADELKFQSTHPRGVRPLSASAAACLAVVSIHAPTRGATCSMIILSVLLMFQSTHPRGVRQHKLGEELQCSRFQSTHPRGVRRSTAKSNNAQSSFNPRTHEGCDG